MAFESISIQTTRNGSGLTPGYREDLVAADTIVLSLTSTTGVLSFEWSVVGRPEFSVAGGAGANPWSLGTSATATFTVDSDTGGVQRDGTYIVQCIINRGSPNETRKSIAIARPTGLTIAAPASTTRALRKIGMFESLEDTSVASLLGGWATQFNRWVEKMRLLASLGTNPTGAASGDLSGTYPGPNVAAVHETSGPTKLTFGAVADGQFFKRSGTGVVGDSVASAVSIRGSRHEDQGGALVAATTRIHWAGLSNVSSTGAYIGGGSTGSLQAIGAGQKAYAYPESFERAVVINRLCIRTNGRVGTTGSPRVKLMVYTEGVLAGGAFSGSPYPATLLGESGNLDIDQGGANKIVEAVGLSIAIPAGSRVWYIWLCNDQAVTNQYTIPTYRSGVLLPILGFTMDATTPTNIATDDATRGVGWLHAITYTGVEAAPATFPQTSPSVLIGADQVLPAVGFGQQIV